MYIYQMINNPVSVAESFVICIRRRGYSAYCEMDGEKVYIITDRKIVGERFKYIGPRQ